MLSQLLIAWGLMAFCVAVHAIGVTTAMRWVRASMAGPRHFWRGVWLFIRLAGWIVFLHLIQITAWALCYVWRGAMPDLQAALYFSPSPTPRPATAIWCCQKTGAWSAPSRRSRGF